MNHSAAEFQPNLVEPEATSEKVMNHSAAEFQPNVVEPEATSEKVMNHSAAEFQPNVVEPEGTSEKLTSSSSASSTPEKETDGPDEGPVSRGGFPTFEEMMRFHQSALLSLTPEQLELLLKFADTLRRQRIAEQKHMECAFCKNNGRPESWYSSHSLKDWRGRVLCPVLRAYRCPLCGASGDQAHTISYCPSYCPSYYWRRCNF